MSDRRMIVATPESYYTSTLTPIILSEGQRVQVSFCGRQVDNPSDKKKNIKGTLVIKKRSKDIADYNDEPKFSKKDIRKNEWVEIEFSTDETFELGKGLYNYYRFFSGKSTNPYDAVTYIEKNDQVEKLQQLLQSDEQLPSLIANIDTQTLNAALNIDNLNRIRNEMASNMRNDQEAAFWQPFFTKNAWILSQLFHSPVMFFNNARYVGGKRMDNHGGQYTDFVLKNDITDNVSIIEIKSPVKGIIGGTYRQSYKFADDLVGGVNQLLLQKDTLVKNYKNMLADADEYYRATNIECILIYGTVSSLNKQEQDAFENYRNELRSIKIVGFDELLKRIDNLLTLFQYRPEG